MLQVAGVKLQLSTAGTGEQRHRGREVGLYKTHGALEQVRGTEQSH